MNRDLNAIAIAGEGFVDRVIDDLVYQMMQAALIRRADIHARSAANGFKAFEHLNLALVIMGIVIMLRHIKPHKARFPLRFSKKFLL